MSAPRSVSINALRMLAAGSRQARYLHMTGPATFPSRAMTGEKSIAALATEAKRSVGERPSVPTSTTNPTHPRTFNTSRTLKQVNDSSTIDFAYMPSSTSSDSSSTDTIRVPMLSSSSSTSNTFKAGEVEQDVHRPIVTTVSEDASHIAMSSGLAETKHEGLGELFEEVLPKEVVEKMEGEKEGGKERGVLATLFGGMLEDVLGKGKVARA